MQRGTQSGKNKPEREKERERERERETERKYQKSNQNKLDSRTFFGIKPRRIECNISFSIGKNDNKWLGLE